MKVKKMKNSLNHWKYQLYFDMTGAQKVGAKQHPQVEMNEFIELMSKENIDIEILESKPIPTGDCWLFLIKCSTPWLGKHLPSYIVHQGLGNNREGKYL